ncbi:hypothetical protein C2G38_2180755, partial [Gigaspora rosea]
MNSSEHEELIVEDHTPHRGKKIKQSYKNYFAIIDITNKSRKILNAQGLKDNKLDKDMDDIAFLENGDLAIAKTQPVFRAYIFSNIELEKNYEYKCKINKNGTLLMHFFTPNVITQWDLITLKFEMQFILNLNLREVDQLEMNSDNTLLAIGSYTKSMSLAVYVYSTKSGTEIANKTFSNEYDEFFDFHKFCFIGSREKERLLISIRNRETNDYIIYILNPLTYTLDKPPDTNVLHDILSQNYEVISDYIIKIDNNNLSIKRLSQNEIRKIIYKLKSAIYLDVPKEYAGDAYTWIVTNEYYERKKRNNIFLKAQIKSNLKETHETSFDSYDSADGYLLEIKVLENDDIIFVSSSGIRIFSKNNEFALKLYGNEIIQQLVQLYKIDDINTQITAVLIELEKYAGNLRVTEKFLLKTNLLFYEGNYINNSSLLPHLQYYGAYFHSYISYTSYFDYLLFWIYENWIFLEKYYPKTVYDYIKYIHLLYLSHFYPQTSKAILLLYLIIINFRQFIHKPIHYIISPWNWSDLAAILFPTIISIKWLNNKAPSIEVIALANLFLEIRFILYFHIIVLAFSHSLHLLLRPTSKYSYNQPSYTNDINNPWNLVPTYQSILPNGTIEGKSFIETPDKNTNMFANF